MQPVLFDSSIYISALRTGEDAVLTLRRLVLRSLNELTYVSS
jgi:hypothetical protein